MPEVQIEIGGRSYTVACQDGEETFLRAAARMLDTEATVGAGPDRAHAVGPDAVDGGADAGRQDRGAGG